MSHMNAAITILYDGTGCCYRVIDEVTQQTVEGATMRVAIRRPDGTYTTLAELLNNEHNNPQDMARAL